MKTLPPIDEEKQDQLVAAAEHIEFALNRIGESDDDDTTLNLLNSLAVFPGPRGIGRGAARRQGPRIGVPIPCVRMCAPRFRLKPPLQSYVLETKSAS